MSSYQKFKPYPELQFLLPPLLVYLFSTFLFEISVDPAISILQKLLAVVKNERVPDLQQMLIELKTRYVWLTSALLTIVIPVVATIFSIVTIRLYMKGSNLAWTVIIAILLCTGNVGYLLYSAKIENALYELVFGFTYKMLIESQMFSSVFLLHIYAIIAIINIIAAIAPILLLLAICGTLHVPPDVDPMDLTLRMNRLKDIINMGSAFLVFGVLHMSMWLNWTASLVPDPGLKSKIAGVAWSISAYWGAAFTLVLTLTYVPSSVHLQNRARGLIAQGKLGGMTLGTKEADQWLKEHGFSFTFSNQLLQVVSILAPILAAPISSALKLL
jgi:hypothetical protein